MKTFELIKKSLLLIAVASAVLLNSCQKDPKTEAQPTLSVPTADLLVSKLGLDYKGSIPSFDIESNTYWTIKMEAVPSWEEGGPEWILLSKRGGNGNSTISLSVVPNYTEDTRTATITITTQFGLTKTIHLLQMDTDETVAFYTDDFGSSANNAPVDSFTGWNYSGIGVDSSKGGLPFSYEGTAVVDKSDPSTGYDGASGGNNILLSGADAGIVMKHIRPLGMVKMDVSFGSASSGASFDSSELILEISSDGENWYDIPYVRGTGAEWEYSTFSLTLAEAYAYIFLRFRTTDGEYRIDDVAVTYGEGGDVYELVVILPPEPEPYKGTTFPVFWKMTAAEYNNKEGIWFSTFSYANESLYILSNQYGNEESLMGPASISYVLGENRPTDGEPFKAEIGTTGQPFVSGAWTDDYWLFTTPVENINPGTIVNISFLTRSSASGMKYFALEYYAGGQWHAASELQNATEDPNIRYTHIMPADASNTLVNCKFVMPDAIVEDDMLIRFRCAGNIRCSNGAVLPTVNGGTHRIAADTGGTGTWATIDITDPNDKPDVVTFKLTSVTVDGKGLRSVKVPAAPAPYVFTVTADWDWTLSTTDLGWATVTPDNGNRGATVSVTILPENYTGLSSRQGWITLTSGDTTLDILVIQDRPGSSEGALKDDGKAVGYVYFEDNFDWVVPFGGPDDVGNINTFAAGVAPDYPSSGYPVVTGTLNMYSAAPAGYSAGDLALAFADHGYEDLFPYALSSWRCIYFGAHYLKFGKTDRQTGIVRTIPGIAEDKGTNISFTFEALPCITGSGNYDQVSLVVEIIDGPGSVGINDGVTTISEPMSVTQTNKTFPWAWQPKEVVLYGVTSETKVTLRVPYGAAPAVAGNTTGTFRYYLDNLKFTKHSLVTQ